LKSNKVAGRLPSRNTRPRPPLCAPVSLQPPLCPTPSPPFLRLCPPDPKTPPRHTLPRLCLSQLPRQRLQRLGQRQRLERVAGPLADRDRRAPEGSSCQNAHERRVAFPSDLEETERRSSCGHHQRIGR